MKIITTAVGLLALSSAWAYEISITEPAVSRAYHRPAQTIEVVANVSPRLHGGDTSAILLNGRVIGDGLTARVPTVDLVAGEYVLTAIVMDKNAKTIASDSKTIYVIQKAPFVQKKQTAIKAREAYDALPWYKKLVIALNPNEQAPQEVNETTPTWEIQ